ncbi:MAG: hypothetical protein J6Y95_01610 [Lachnospiraceae bacterium]|nr:hypothetical protein [Lachnospiraceae bacterium]
MKKSRILVILLSIVLALSGCAQAVRSVDLKLSGRKIDPVYPSTGLLLSGNMAETVYDAQPETPAPASEESTPEAETQESAAESESPMESSTEAPETEAPQTEAPQTEAPETLPPATEPTKARPSETQPPQTRAPETTTPKTTVPPASTAPHTADTVERIEILTPPDKTVYDQYHERISSKGLTLLAHWPDGYEAVITEGFTIFDVNGNTEPETTEEGVCTIFERYGNQTASFSISFTLAENAPLEIDGYFHSARKFYVGESLRHLCLGAWVGGEYIPGSELVFSQEIFDKPGIVTVTVSWQGHKDERTFSVLPADQYELTMEDLEWLRSSDDTSGTQGMTLTAAWFYERLWEGNPNMVSYRPLPTDVIPEEEFQFTPAVVTYQGVQQVTCTCRGLSISFWVGLY